MKLSPQQCLKVGREASQVAKKEKKHQEILHLATQQLMAVKGLSRALFFNFFKISLVKFDFILNSYALY